MTKREWLKLFSFFLCYNSKNINFLRRPSKKADFIIENIFEEGNIIDDKKIIEFYFERNEQAIKETDIKYGKLCKNLQKKKKTKKRKWKGNILRGERKRPPRKS